MDEVTCLEDLMALQRKEKRELLAKVQGMKRSVPKGDKKRKKDITFEIANIIAELDLKHETEVKEYEEKDILSKATTPQRNEAQETSATSDDPGEKNESDIVTPTYIYTMNSEATEYSEPQKLSKAQRRRNRKALIEKERTKAIAEQEIKNLTGVRHYESEEIKKKLSERHLIIHEVPSDGNCLYKAVEHQLSVLDVKETTVESLRKLTAAYLLSHKDDYIPFLTCPETGDVLTEEKYAKYCEDIVETTAWGGHVEVQALSHVCGFPIEVIQAEGPSVIAGDETSTRRLILSYHRHIYGLGEHYNSVIPAITVD